MHLRGINVTRRVELRRYGAGLRWRGIFVKVGVVTTQGTVAISENCISYFLDSVWAGPCENGRGSKTWWCVLEGGACPCERAYNY